jgi:hypothetical protein
MGKRLLFFAGGLLLGSFLRLEIPAQQSGAEPATIAATGDARCAAHPVKMPCLFNLAYTDRAVVK